MGKLDKQRNFLCLLFPEACCARLPDGFTVDVMLMDLQPAMAFILDKRFPFFDSQRVGQRMAECIRYHMNNENHKGRCAHTGSFVVMWDTPHNVPKNKAATQRSRDTTRSSDQAVADDEMDVETTAGPRGPHMDEQMYNELVEARGGDTESLFIDVGVPAPATLRNTTVWRSVTLGMQMRRLITHFGMQLEVKPQQTLIFDDGVAVSASNFLRVRRQMVQNNGWEKRSAFERECLVHALMIENNFYSRLILYDDRQFHRAGPSCVGEADIKMLPYIQPHNGAKRYLVKNPDTDTLFILLKHMPHLLNGLSEEEAQEVEVWLDMQSPLEWADKNRPYRFINVKLMYQGLLRFFAGEYPTVTHPLETFCALMLAPHTDFTHPFESCLGLTVRTIWNAFSELHSSQMGRDGKGYVKFGDDMSKQLQREHTTVYHSSMRGVLNDAVAYDWETRQYHIHREPFSRFFYYLCQAPLMSARASVSLPVLNVKGVMRVQDLLLCARELDERMELYRTRANVQIGTLVQRTHSDVDFSALFNELVPAPAQALLSEPDVKAYLAQNGTGLAALCAKTSAPLYGVPTRAAMNAFIRRLVWYMKLCRHGYEQLRHAQDCGSLDEEGRSFYGWRTQECRDASARNSNYNAMCVSQGQLKCYETVECENVIVF